VYDLIIIISSECIRYSPPLLLRRNGPAFPETFTHSLRSLHHAPYTLPPRQIHFRPRLAPPSYQILISVHISTEHPSPRIWPLPKTASTIMQLKTQKLGTYHLTDKDYQAIPISHTPNVAVIPPHLTEVVFCLEGAKICQYRVRASIACVHAPPQLI
jgi:hypothetical protein